MSNSADFVERDPKNIPQFHMNKKDQQKYLTRLESGELVYGFLEHMVDTYICFDFDQTENLNTFDVRKSVRDIQIFNNAKYLSPSLGDLISPSTVSPVLNPNFLT